MIKVTDANGLELDPAKDSMLGNAYEASSTDLPDLKAWQPGNWGPNTALDYELESIVARARDAERNNGLAASGITTTLDNVVGTGFQMQARPDYRAIGQTSEWAEAFAKEVEALWRPYAGSKEIDVTRFSNFQWLTRLVFRTLMTSGSVLVLPYYMNDRRHRTCFLVVETDRLVTPLEQQRNERVRNGIEYNALGEAIAYYVAKKHPGEIERTGSTAYMHIPSSEIERIPARTKFGRKRVIHIYDRLRPGQGTGVPLITSVLRQLRMLDRYQVSELQAAVVNAMVAAFIETDMSSEQVAGLFGGDVNSYLEEKKKWEIKFQGGSILNLFPGTKLNPFIPSRPNNSYDQFTTSLMRHMATALNVPYELLAKDFSKTNYSSARAALLEASRHFMVRRRALVSDWCEEVYTLWLQEKVMRGEVAAPDYVGNEWAYSRARWIGPGRGWVDPVKEAEAARMRMELGLSSLADEAAEQGHDWEEIHEQRKRERDVLEADDFGVPMIPKGGEAGSFNGSATNRRFRGGDEREEEPWQTDEQ